MDLRTGVFAVLLGALLFVSLQLVLPFLPYVVTASLLAFALEPLHRRLAPAVGPRPAAFLVVVAAAAAVVALLAALLGPIAAGASNLPGDLADLPRVRAAVGTVETTLGIDLPVESLLASIPDRIVSLAADRGVGVAAAGVHATLGLLLLAFLLYYLLVDGDALVAWLGDVTPLPEPVQDDLLSAAEEITWAVLKGHVLVAIAQGLVSGLGLVIVGIPYAVFWTFVMMVLALVPIVGVAPVLGGATLYLFLHERVLAAAFVVVYGMTAVAAIDDYLRAILVDRDSSLHSGAVLLGVFGGVYVFGAIGLFLGPILLGLLKATVEVFDEYYVPNR